MRTTSRLLTFLLLAGAAGSVGRAADQAKVEEAIKKGAAYLKANSLGGSPNSAQGGDYGSGPLALAGLAMLEAGIPPSDPVLVDLAERVRSSSYGESRTYQVSLGIVFLDRYGDTGDRPLIQVLGARLLAGQNAAGGWTYTTFDSIDPSEAARLASVLRSSAKPKPPTQKEEDGFNVNKPTPKDATAGLHPEAGKIVRAVRAGMRANHSNASLSEDNSNTQFGIIGLWVARRRGLPCDANLRLIETRFVRSQSTADHGWAYNVGSGNTGSSPSMTCAGLIGLAVGKAVAEAKPKKKEEEDPFFAPQKPDPGSDDEGGGAKKGPPPTARDAAIERALGALGRLLASRPAGQAVDTGMGGAGDLYFFWSLERVGMAYGLDTIGGVNWFNWGAGRLLPMQTQDGSWPGGYGSTVSTSFAVLFLCRSNFVTDLTKTINGKTKDPGESSLTGRRGPLALSPKGRAADAPKGGPVLPAGPEMSDPQAAGRVELLATALVNAEEKDWKKRLDAARDRKGPEYTLCILAAMPHLDDTRQTQARAALAERLVRMTPDTLKKMIADRDPELRRAAILAAAMRDERPFAPDIIERVTDIDDGVTRAARAALKSLSDGKDFGPPSGASDEAKRKAADDWRFWYASEGRK